jgi:dUTP pyrophosphatase
MVVATDLVTTIENRMDNMNSFELKVVLDDFACPITKGHDADAGFDLRLPKNSKPKSVSFFRPLVVDTGVHVNIPKGYVGMIKSKSGLNVKANLVGEGVIDAGYTGSIVVKLYCNKLFGRYVFYPEDKLIQLVLLPIPEVSVKYVDTVYDFDEIGTRKNFGFGSTGR